MSIKFILNQHLVQTNQPSGMVLLDFIRYNQGQMGTKIGCREGDCGACTVLMGSLTEQGLQYQSVNSCLAPLARVAGKHVVTIEGLNLESSSFGEPALSKIQQAMVAEGATQCGFCTPGFVVSLAGFCLNFKPGKQLEAAIAAIDGNICRCTGYKSIEKAAARILNQCSTIPKEKMLDFLVDHHFIPGYFKEISTQLSSLKIPYSPVSSLSSGQPVGGGTDLYVQRAEYFHDSHVRLLNLHGENRISQQANRITIPANCTVTEFCESPVIQQLFPGIVQMKKLVAATPIRNLATLAGNLVNASPIGDFSMLLLAMPTSVLIKSSNEKDGPVRTVDLRQFFKKYKEVDLNQGENLHEICIDIPSGDFQLHFEKVSKRTHLDIASVNTAFGIVVTNQKIQYAAISAGGVGPVPLYLAQTSQWLIENGEQLNEPEKIASIWKGCLEMATQEISPISDARGSAAYKTLLLRQLITTHFMHFFPQFEPNISALKSNPI